MICGFRLAGVLRWPEIGDWLGCVGVGAFGGGFLSEAVLFLVVVGMGACETGLRFIFVALMFSLPWVIMGFSCTFLRGNVKVLLWPSLM